MRIIRAWRRVGTKNLSAESSLDGPCLPFISTETFIDFPVLLPVDFTLWSPVERKNSKDLSLRVLSVLTTVVVLRLLG